jgi:hypothetical protein
MKMKQERTGIEGKRPGLAAKTVLAGSLLLSGCSPDVTVHNTFYDPNAPVRPDAGCTAVPSCASATVYLREENSKAGPNTATMGGATLRLVRIEDEGSTKAAVLELSGCGKKAEGKFLPGASTVLGIGRDSVLVTLESMDYDVGGLRLKAAMKPVCPPDGGIMKADSSHDSKK